jgi:oxygen-dependent protoporphyrinogen oxidase
MPRMVELERRFGSVTRGVLDGMRRGGTPARAAANHGRGDNSGTGPPSALFLSLRAGMQQLIDALAARLEGRIRRVTATVQRIAGSSGGFQLAAGGDAILADEVVLATPAYRAGELLREIDADLALLLETIRYNSSVTVALLYARPEFDHPLDGFGFIVPRAEGRPLTACTWVNTKFPYRAAANRALLRAFLGGERAEQAAADSDEHVVALAHRELSSLMQYRPQPAAWRIHRWPRAMAQYEVGHLRRQQDIEQRLGRHPGLWLTGNAYIGIGVPDCIHRSRLVAQAIGN